MRRMKKAIAMGLATMMTISLAACGNTSGETTQETSGAATTENTGSGENLTFSWWGNQTRNDMTMKVIDMYCAENAGVSIDGQFSTFSDYWEKLATYAAGNSLPDVIQMDYKYLQQYADKGLLISLDDYIESGLLDVSGMSEDNLNIGAVDGSIYGICLTVSPPAMIYNATLLNENGIEIHDNMSSLKSAAKYMKRRALRQTFLIMMSLIWKYLCVPKKEDPYTETEHWDVKQRILWLNISRYMKKALKKDG